MKKGPLKWRLAILRSSSMDDGTATVDGDPEVIMQRWASKVDISDGERVRASEQGSEITTRFQVRSDPLTRSISGSDVLQCDGRTYEVVAAKEVGGFRDAIEITAVARTDLAS